MSREQNSDSRGLEIRDAAFGYQKGQKRKTVLEGISFTLEPGQLLCVLGANGTGKTTMYRTILGFLPLLGGEITVAGRSIRTFSRQELAHRIAYVPQYHEPPFPYTVLEVVLMGRGSHVSTFGSPGKKDEAIALEMIERMGIEKLKNEVYTEISGGERQLTLIARALAQQADYLLMDEPTSNLDFGNQIRLLEEIRSLSREGYAICFTSHYPDHAFLTDASVLALEGRKKWSTGPAKDLITPELIRNMYGLEAEILTYEGKEGTRMRHVAVEPDWDIGRKEHTGKGRDQNDETGII